MNTLLKATERGQVTIPKEWREQFGTQFYFVERKDNMLVLKPAYQEQSFEDTVEKSWNEYKNGEVVEGSTLMEEYGI